MSKKDDTLDKVFDFFLNEDIDIVLSEIEKREPDGFAFAIAESIIESGIRYEMEETKYEKE